MLWNPRDQVVLEGKRLSVTLFRKKQKKIVDAAWGVRLTNVWSHIFSYGKDM